MNNATNNPPITPPTNEDMLEDLQHRFPEIETEQKDFEEALATYPEDIVDDDTAAALQDVLGKMKKHKTRLGSYKKEEKKPWDSISNVIKNFFVKHEETVDGWLNTWQPRYQAYLDKKKAAAQRKAEEEAKKQREEAERLKREADAAEERKRKAEEEERLARQREEQARLRAEEEDRKRKEAEARAAAAKAEADRLDRERKAREKAEKEEAASEFRQMKQFMRTAEKLAEDAAAGTILNTAMDVFEDLVLEGGEISRLGTKLRHSPHLDDDQRAYLQEVKESIDGWRQARQDRLAAAAAEERKAAEAEAARRRQAEAERQREEAAAAAVRAAQRKADEDAAAAARADRVKAEQEAAAAKAATRAAQVESRAAAADARDAYADQKTADREVRVSTEDAARSENRADRIDNKLQKSTDADLSRTYGDLGTTGSLTKSWKHYITDDIALKAAMRAAVKPESEVYGELIDLLKPEDLNGAVFRFMRLHQGSWTGRDRVDDVLAGVTFAYEQGLAIRT